MRKIYLASSWRNQAQQNVLCRLRQSGHEVYDFTHPAPDVRGFAWSEIDPDYRLWGVEDFVSALRHPAAVRGFKYDHEAVEWADTGVLLLPAGRSAHTEIGRMSGQGKETFALMPAVDEPELMYKWFTGIFGTLEDLITALGGGVAMRQPVSVLQEWVQRLTFMQQSVLVTAVRGPDGIDKNHVSKLLLRWLRRCVLYSAFESKIARAPASFGNPWAPGGGSFTGPSISWETMVDIRTRGGDADPWEEAMNQIVSEYLSSLDMVPHHFQLHFMHAVEILGYKHPDERIRVWWSFVYRRLANDMHLNPETEVQMDKRLGDFQADWRAAEEVTAKGV